MGIVESATIFSKGDYKEFVQVLQVICNGFVCCVLSSQENGRCDWHILRNGRFFSIDIVIV